MVVRVEDVPVANNKISMRNSTKLLFIFRKCFTKSSPNKLHVCKIILLSHFSFGSGGGVPAIGCGRGRGIAVVADFTV